MMIIVSQDGTSLVNFDNVTEIRVKKVTQFLKPDENGTSLVNFDNVTEIRVKKVTQFLKPDENSERVPRVPRVPVETYKIAIFFIGEEDYVSIGEFKTEEKAMGVLDDFLTNLFNNVFGIPKDEVTE